ncbi:MAG: META domain-containing protein [Proteobacteria bacterium]|nr:MAG: META domain-containing protein [Pseudomonadota bacterium]
MNKVFYKVTLLLSVFGLLSACQPASETKVVPDNHQAKTALDWSGVYQGTLPCASCPGIKTLITIDKAGQFLKQAHYINTQGEYIERGQIQWQDDGTVIHLMGDDVDAVNYYKVVENALLHLNADKQVIGGDMAEFYRLEKITITLQNTNWQLTDVVNVAFKSEVLSRVTMNFDNQGRLNGRAPCNQFFADYQTSADSLLLERVGSTKMACSYMHEEQQFFNALGQVAGYEIHLNELILKDADKQPLLRFMAKVDKNLTKSKD